MLNSVIEYIFWGLMCYLIVGLAVYGIILMFDLDQWRTTHRGLVKTGAEDSTFGEFLLTLAAMSMVTWPYLLYLYAVDFYTERMRKRRLPDDLNADRHRRSEGPASPNLSNGEYHETEPENQDHEPRGRGPHHP